jgi:hypothetical protein
MLYLSNASARGNAMATRTLIGVLLSFATLKTAVAVIPGLLVYSQNYGQFGATSMEVTITIEAAPPEGSPILWAQQFFTSYTVDHGGLFGIQANGVIGGQNVGKLLVFSIWNADQAAPGPGATAEPFGGGAAGYSVRLPLQWAQGVPYRFRLEKEPFAWWRLSVSTPGSPPALIGRIRITRDVPLQDGFQAYTEYFGDLGSCADLPHAIAGFSDFVLGTTVVPVDNVAANGACVTHARGFIRGNAAVHEVRPLFSDGFE